MAQYDFKITDFERIFRKGYRIIIATVAASLTMSVVLVKLQPLNYRASTVIKYDSKNVLSGLDNEAALMSYDYFDDIEKVANDVTGYPVLLRAAQKLDLVADTVSNDIRNATDSIQAIVQALADRITTLSNASANTITLTATARNPVEARDLANAVAYAFKEFSFERKKIQVLKTKSFIQKQLERIQNELFEVETELIEFEESKRLPSMGANASRIISRSDRLDENIEEIDNRLAVIAAQRRQLLARIPDRQADSSAGPAGRNFTWVSEFIDDDPGLAQLNDRLISQQIERDNQLAYYKADHPVITSLNASIDETVQRLVRELDKKAASLGARKQSLAGKRRQVVDELRDIPRNEIDYLRLKRRHTVKEEIYTMFSKRLQEASIAEAGIIDDMEIIALAKIPRRPVNDDLFKAIGIGLFIGLIVGILIVILQELLDTSIGTIEDVEQTMKLPVIAVIPQLQHTRDRKKFSLRKESHHEPKQSSLVTHFNPKEFSAEAFRILRTNIDFYCQENKYQTYLFTSSTMSEGKSTTISNLSIAFAQQGKKTLLLECNLRRPSLEKIFGISRGAGISDILIEKVTWESCVMTVTDLALGTMQVGDILSTPGLQNFYFIPHGHKPTNPTELLSSARMKQLLKTLKEDFDIIFIDAPPVLPVADSIVLSKIVDSVVLVYKVGTVPKKTFLLCKERLDAVQANILGVVLNGLKPQSGGSSYSKYAAKAYKEAEGRHKKPASQQSGPT
ncbi:MAG: polysaccharide biosynthesis tyrosine autokinase [Chitinispirillaceae bacterium]|nr:polysaccharide biosynthesis tyrosine autokinase [Chitinispirillaceae bacterium]